MAESLWLIPCDLHRGAVHQIEIDDMEIVDPVWESEKCPRMPGLLIQFQQTIDDYRAGRRAAPTEAEWYAIAERVYA